MGEWANGRDGMVIENMSKLGEIQGKRKGSLLELSVV